jgi:hypothetical protein
VCQRHENSLQKRMSTGERAPGDPDVVAAEQARLRCDRRATVLAEEGRWRHLDERVTSKPLRLPRLGVGAEEDPLASDGDAHRCGHGRRVLFERRQHHRLAPAEDLGKLRP